MIGIKNSKCFYRFVAAISMVSNILFCTNIKCQASGDIVDSYSETFFQFYGFFPYEYCFRDSPKRNLTINFLGKDQLIIKNNVSKAFRNAQLSFCDTVYFHVISPSFKDIESHRQIIVDSVTSTRAFSNSYTVPPYRSLKCANIHMIFPFLQNSDTIFVNTNCRNLRIRDFEFSVHPQATLPDGIALKKVGVKFLPQERMRPEIYRKFLEWVKEQHDKDDGLIPNEAVLKLIDKYYNWNAH